MISEYEVEIIVADVVERPFNLFHNLIFHRNY